MTEKTDEPSGWVKRELQKQKLADQMLALSIQLRDEILNFVKEYHGPMDGELWSEMDNTAGELRQDHELLTGLHLTESGLQIMLNRIEVARRWFDEQKSALLEHLGKKGK